MFVRSFLCVVVYLGCCMSWCFASEPGQGIDPYFLTNSPKSEAEQYTHNGSDVIIESRGDSIHIRYEKPRAGLASVGAKQGTLLFVGRRTGDNVEGTAFVFKANCQPAPYSVRGRFNSRLNLILEGFAPHWDPNSCAITTYTNATAQSRLILLEAFGDI